MIVLADYKSHQPWFCSGRSELARRARKKARSDAMNRASIGAISTLGLQPAF
jgi:hypothetical protein